MEINRTRIPSESKNSLPADTSYGSAENANTLFEWLGSFWAEVYQDPDFIKELQTGRALRIAQLYLDLLENLKLEDRENAPVFHRERWHPIVLRKSRRNMGAKDTVKLTSETTEVNGEKYPVVNLGVQTNPVYREGTEIVLGGRETNYKGMVIYPLEGGSEGLKSILACVCNSITDAKVVLGNGTGFAVLDGAIAIAENQDPFEGENADLFPKFETLGENEGEGDVETVLWACDALFDRNFIYEGLGYAMRLPTGSSEIYKRVVNAAWNITASGATPLLLRSLIASICGVPTVKEEGEVVERVYRFADGPVRVITDKNVYDFPEHTKIRKNVKAGAVLHRFDTMDKAIRVYACTTDVHRLAEYNDFLDDEEEFTEDVPAVDLPPALFRSDIKKGFSVGWEQQEVICTGFYPDINDPETDPEKKRMFPKLRFSLGGAVEDENTFWEDAWKSYEAAGKSMEDCLEGFNHGKIDKVGPTDCWLAPIEYFMHNLIGANTLIITVRTDTLADDAPLYDPKFFGVIRESIPSYIRLFVIEHTAVKPDKFNTGTRIYEEARFFVHHGKDETVKYGGRGKGAKMKEHVSSKWVASCRDKDEYDDYE